MFLTISGDSFFEITINVLKSLVVSVLIIVNIFLMNADHNLIIAVYSNTLTNDSIYLLEFWVIILHFLAFCSTVTILIYYFSTWSRYIFIKYISNDAQHIFYGSSSRHEKVIETLVETGEQIIVTEVQNYSNSEFRGFTKYLVTNRSIEEFIHNKRKKYYYLLDYKLSSIEMALYLINYYGERKTSDILFVQDIGGLIEQYLQKQYRNDDCLKVRLVNSERTIIYNFFYMNKDLLHYYLCSKSHIILWGDTAEAKETFKLLLWLTQIIDSYKTITFYTTSKVVEDLKLQMPAIFSKLNLDIIPNYTIEFKNLSEYGSKDILKQCKELEQLPIVFIFDEDIPAIKLAKSIKSFNDDILVIIGLQNNISEYLKKEIDCLIINLTNLIIVFDSDLESRALQLHKKYELLFLEKTFYNNPYSYFSSLSRALGEVYLDSEMYLDFDKLKPNFASLEKEHNRWAIYLKTEGWRYSPVRNNRKKHHPLLVPFSQLSDEDKLKDIN